MIEIYKTNDYKSFDNDDTPSILHVRYYDLKKSFFNDKVSELQSIISLVKKYSNYKINKGVVVFDEWEEIYKIFTSLNNQLTTVFIFIYFLLLFI